MADKPLIRDWFLLAWKTDDDANRTVADPTGVFSCRQSTSRFLDIPESRKFKGDFKIKVRGGIRVFTLADGTVLGTGAKNTNKKNADYERLVRKVVGKKRVIIKTGKKISGSPVNTPRYHTISFAFPANCPILAIQDALGELIADTKKDGKATGIFPTFKLDGGGSYAIVSNASGTTSTAATTVNSEIVAKLQANGGGVVN